ncbi:MAG: hypothetical protein AAF790_08310 [Planctomycetota bacterium]
MAARSDQTLQIALVTFIGTSLLLLCFLIYVNRLKADYRQEAEKLRSDKTAEASKARSLQTENETLRQQMGMGQFDSADAVQKQFDEDVKTYASTLAPADQVYRKMVTRFYEENKRSTEQESQAKEREKALKQRLLATEAEKNAQIKEFEDTLKKVQEDAARERNAFRSARADLEEKREELAASLERQRVAHEKELTRLTSQVSDLDGQLAKAKKTIETLINNRAQDDPSFEIADGAVAYVNQANRTVWINIGEQDALRRQVTFSVYEQTEADAGKAPKKASIEVIRMLGDHLAEARITDDDARNPILPGDWIYSPLWHRGKQIRFALTGVLDLDGDQRADLQQAKDLIALNGGVVDASVTDDGSVEGEMTVETRYLVLGDYPSLPSQTNLATSWKDMNREAANLGVETITMSEFLNQMGYKPLNKSVTLGDGARAADFQPKPSKFRPRSPYAGR